MTKRRVTESRVKAANPISEELEIQVPDLGVVSAQLEVPVAARALLVLAHGAGAGRDHRLMNWSARLALEVGIGVLRYNFLYMEEGKRRPDPEHRAHAVVRAAVDTASRLRPELPLLAGGRSFGARMTSQAQAAVSLPGVRGLVFFAFPLHPPGKPGVVRAEHLDQVTIPMLFLSGTRDELAEPELLGQVCQRLAPKATLAAIEGGNHSFAVLKRSGRTEQDVADEVRGAIEDWLPVVLS